MLARKLSKREQLDEIILLKNLAQGDSDSFNTLYDTHVRQLTGYVVLKVLSKSILVKTPVY